MQGNTTDFMDHLTLLGDRSGQRTACRYFTACISYIHVMMKAFMPTVAATRVHRTLGTQSLGFSGLSTASQLWNHA